MPTALTRQRILDTAEQAFAEHGYTGASIRTITKTAEVDLGAIRYHFGSKDGLFGEVIRRVIEPLCAQRLERLDALEAEFPDGPLPLEPLIERSKRSWSPRSV